MKIIALLPVRNEAWVLPHSLACLSAFCDVILVNDQQLRGRLARDLPAVSEGRRARSRPSSQICEQAAGSCWTRRATTTATTCSGAPTPTNWCRRLGSADSSTRQRDALVPGTVVECTLPSPVERRRRIPRDRARLRARSWKPIALRRRSPDGLRPSRELPLHEPRVPLDGAAGTIVQADEVAGAAPAVAAAAAQPDEAGVVPLPRVAGRLADGRRDQRAATRVTLPSVPVPDQRRCRRRGSRHLRFPDLVDRSRRRRGSERDVLRLVRGTHAGILRAARDLAHRRARDDVPRAASDARRGPIGRTGRRWPTRAMRLGTRAVAAARRRLPI